MVLELARCEYIERRENVIALGNSGTGKTCSAANNFLPPRQDSVIALATSLHNLAALYRSRGRYTDAEPLYKRVVAIFEKALGTTHPYVATSLNGLAALYDDQGRYADAEPAL